MAMLEEVCHYGWNLRLEPHSTYFLCFVLMVKDVSSQLPAAASMPAVSCHAYALW